MVRRTSVTRAVAALVTIGASAGFPAYAAGSADGDTAELAASSGPSIAIAPLRVDIDSGTNGATVFVSNSSSREVAVQSRVFAWDQAGGEDAYKPTSDVVLSPSISMIPPGETQIVRVLRKVGSAGGEKRFRLVVDQLPDPKSVQSGSAATRIRFTLPVFLDGDTAGAPSFAWRLSNDRIELANTGGSTARILGITVTTAGGQKVEPGRNTLRYVHGNATIAWPIGGGCSLGAVKITAQIDGRTVDAQPVSACS